MTEQEIKALRVGDGVVDIETGQNFYVREFRDGRPVVCHRSWGHWVLYTGQADWCRRETFREYLTRPTGFGGWSWWLFAPIALMSRYGLFIGISTWHDGGWFAVAFIAVLWAVIIWWMHRNYTGKAR